MPQSRLARMLFGRIPRQGLVGTMFVVASLLGAADLAAQERSSGPRTGGSTTSSSKGAVRQTAAEEPAAPGKPLRPAASPMRVKNVPPELMKLLKDWEVSSAKVKKLEGEHRRWEYDYVFNVVKLNTGVFYYESPDKGRIDLKPDSKQAGTLEDKRHWENGQLVQFKRQPGPAERWYCDGQLITSVDDQQLLATRMFIPKQNQGANIIDGPLPFLFGMPAEKALQRYDLDLKSLNAGTGKAILRATPLWPSDAANYQLAEIILDTKVFLPDAVRLIDPAGTKETVFKFEKLEKNRQRIVELWGVEKWFGKTPFKFEDKKYRVTDVVPRDERVENANGIGGGRVTPAGGTRPPLRPAEDSGTKTTSPPASAKTKSTTAATPQVPSVIGLHGKKAREVLEALGYQVSLKRGSIANRDEELYHIERQEPAPKTALAKGETVRLWAFIPEE